MIHVFRTDGPVVANAPVIAKTENIAAGFEIKNISGAVEIRIGEPCAGVEQAICQFVTGDQLKARDPSRLVVPPVADRPKITCGDTTDHIVFVEVPDGVYVDVEIAVRTAKLTTHVGTFPEGAIVTTGTAILGSTGAVVVLPASVKRQVKPPGQSSIERRLNSAGLRTSIRHYRK